MENEIEVIPDKMFEKSSTVEEQIEAQVAENSTDNGKEIESTDVESVTENQSSEQVVRNSDNNGCQNIEEQECQEKKEPEKQLKIPVMKVCLVDDADNDTNITESIEEETEVLPDKVNNIDESGLSPQSITANDDIPPSEGESFTILDSDNPSECSPEKSQNSEKPNKMDLLSLLSSPSQTELDDSFSKNELDTEIYDEEPSFDESNEDENGTDEDNDHNGGNENRRPTNKHRSSSTFKKSNDYPVFELTDDNSSEDDMRSDDDEEYNSDAQSMSSMEDIVHNIDDSDDEPEEKCARNMGQISSPASPKYRPKEIDNPYERNYYDDQEKELRYVDPNYTQRHNYIRDVLQKQSASKLYRYMAVKRSITCLNNRMMRNSRGVNRISDEFNDDIEPGSTSELIVKSSSIDATVSKERNSNENTEPNVKLSNESSAKSGKSTIESDNNKANAQCASVNDANNKLTHQKTNKIDVNDLTISLDQIDNDDLVVKEKCAKRILDDDIELGMDVDDPSEDLYLTHSPDTNRYDRFDAGANRTIKLENSVTIECEEESSKSISADENNVTMNGTNKAGQSSDSTNANDENENTTVKTSDKSNKRKISISSDEDSEPPSKIAKTDAEVNFPRHDKMIRRMIESSNSAKSNDPDTLQRDIDQLNNEIETLGEAARTKEIEWNNILYLKKMKEEMLLRLSRRKTIMEIMQSTKSIDSPENLFLNNNFDNVNEMNAMESRKTLGNVTPATSFIMSRCNMKSVDLAKEKSNLNELYRNIQPKTSQRSDAPVTFSNVITSIPKSSPAMQFQTTLLQQRLRENGQSFLNSNNQTTDQSSNKLQIGRQGQIKDVQSIIANFRQTHPEAVPRRGRRLKNVNQGYYPNEHGISSGGDATEALVAEMLSKHNNDLSSPPTSNDSNYSNSQIMITKAGPSNHFTPLTPDNFKQAFNENNIIAGMSLKGSGLLTSTPLFKNQGSGIGYPEVTLHPIQSTMLQNQKHLNENMSDAHANSLLHGILTKKLKGSNTVATGLISSNVNTTGFNNAFSPTLARLLTAPERNIALTSALTGNSAGSSSNNSNNNNNNNFFTNQTTGINLSKTNSSRTHENKPEISCLPISQMLLHQNNSLLQQQLQRNQRDINKLLPKNNVFNLDDEADDSDRLIIDEGDQYSNSEMIGGASNKKDDSPDGELPECQGCKKREAQFVCADCKSQWYCSRECQVMAWDEHSEVCAR